MAWWNVQPNRWDGNRFTIPGLTLPPQNSWQGNQFMMPPLSGPFSPVPPAPPLAPPGPPPAVMPSIMQPQTPYPETTSPADVQEQSFNPVPYPHSTAPAGVGGGLSLSSLSGVPAGVLGLLGVPGLGLIAQGLGSAGNVQDANADIIRNAATAGVPAIGLTNLAAPGQPGPLPQLGLGAGVSDFAANITHGLVGQPASAAAKAEQSNYLLDNYGNFDPTTGINWTTPPLNDVFGGAATQAITQGLGSPLHPENADPFAVTAPQISLGIPPAEPPLEPQPILAPPPPAPAPDWTQTPLAPPPAALDPFAYFSMLDELAGVPAGAQYGADPPTEESAPSDYEQWSTYDDVRENYDPGETYGEYHKGGRIKGRIPGKIEDVPIMAREGEYVLNPVMTARIGKEALDKINKGKVKASEIKKAAKKK